MNNPTSEQAYAVAKVFRDAVSKYPRAKLNMYEGYVNEGDHQCGTVHCHGGWYAVMKCDLSKDINFLEGSYQMAVSLGFESDDDLEIWARNNPKIWGNRRGYAMFCEEDAFHSESRPDGAQNLQDIADHWQEVGDRLNEIENNQTT